MNQYFHCGKCGGTFDPAFTYCPNCDGAEVTALRVRNTELEAENARLKEGLVEGTREINATFDKLHATNLYTKQLRETLASLLDELMSIAVSNGANSISMPDYLVAAAVLLEASPLDAAIDAREREGMMRSNNRIASMHVQAMMLSMMELPNEMKIMILPRDPGKLLHFEPELSRPKFNDLTKRRNGKRKRNPNRWR